MNWKTLTGTISLAAALGVGVLAGSVLSPSASAGVPAAQVNQAALAAQTTPSAQASPTAVPGSGQPSLPGGGMHRGGRAFGGPGGPGGPGGMHDFDGGYGPGFDGGRGAHVGGAYTADGATRAISSTTTVLDLVKGDLAYAAGKTDTATAQDWVDKAGGLLSQAQSASGSGEFGKAVETAGAARDLAGAAEMLLQQALGASTLPSYTQRQGQGRGAGGHMGMGPGPGIGPSGTYTLTQVQASRVLAGFYRNLTSAEALVNSAPSKGDAATYLAAAKSQYSKAYTAYQAGNYNEAAGSAGVGQALLRVVDSLLRAGTAPSSPDTPVQVPPPFV